jgi:manganese transport protein
MFFAIAGAAVETGLSAAYCIAQFFGWPWGRYMKPYQAPRFTLAWLLVFTAALLMVLSGIDPLKLVEWAVVFSVIVLPLTYLPVILQASDRKYMKEHANGPFNNILGWTFYIVVAIAAVGALPLYFITSGGKG